MLSDAGSGQTSVVMKPFTSGRVVQDGDRNLVLNAFNSFGGGITIENGTVELAAANAAGSGGGVHFVEAASGALLLATLKLDSAFADTVSGGTTEYLPNLSGFGFDVLRIFHH